MVDEVREVNECSDHLGLWRPLKRLWRERSSVAIILLKNSGGSEQGSSYAGGEM